MKKVLISILVFVGCISTSFASEGIHWISDYKEALDLSRKTDKPILLLFTGTGWCSYCHKLEREILETSQFANAVGGRYIFVKMDFSPMGQARDPSFSKQHEDLGQRYQIQGFPTVVVLDRNEQVLLRTGYRQLKADQYASYLQQEIDQRILHAVR